MVIQSLTGSDVVTCGDASNQPLVFALLDALGKQPADLTFAWAGDQKGALPLFIGVIAVDGADPAAIADAIVKMDGALDPAMTVTKETIGGKSVTVIDLTDPNDGVRSLQALYASGGRLFRVGALTRTYLADALLLIK